MNTSAYAENALREYRWDNRILLIFSPRADDMRVRALDEIFHQRSCELTERDLIVGRVPAFGDARLAERVLSPASAVNLQKDFGVDPGDFAVVLVGKDGFEKLRTSEIPDLDQIFELIDGMPMRRAEMRSRDQGCSA